MIDEFPPKFERDVENTCPFLRHEIPSSLLIKDLRKLDEAFHDESFFPVPELISHRQVSIMGRPIARIPNIWGDLKVDDHLRFSDLKIKRVESLHRKINLPIQFSASLFELNADEEKSIIEGQKRKWDKKHKIKQTRRKNSKQRRPKKGDAFKQ